MLKNNLYTFGGEYQLPSGQEYIGDYHIHPDKGAMVGATHSPGQHEYLVPFGKTIKSFDFDYSDLPATSEKREFIIFADSGSEFKLEIKDNTTGYYYNFVTNTFQTAESSLQKEVTGNSYKGSVKFPAVTGGDDQYDIYLYAIPGTKHATYNEVRFADGSIDINSSTGSSSLMMQKVIYQYAALTLTLQGHSIGSTIAGTYGTDTISINRGKNKEKTAFSFTTTAGATAAYRILRQPTSNDTFAYVEPVIGAAPELLPGENEYPTARAAFTGDDVNGAVTSGSVVRMDNTDLSAVIEVGDKITTATTTGTVNGGLTEATVVTIDETAADLMAVGDQVTGPGCTGCDAAVVLVTVVATGGNANRFTVDQATDWGDGRSLTFSSKINRSPTTVTVVETSGTATDFTMSQAIQLRDNAPLTFTPQMNYQWPINNYANIIKGGMTLFSGTNVTADTVVSSYEDSVTNFSGTEQEQTIISYEKGAIDTKGVKPVISKGLVTTQTGNIIFDKQQKLALAGDTVQIGGYGESNILDISGWHVKFTDLAIALTAPTTTTTEASAGGSSADIAVTDREGVINNVSRVGGIGINPALQNPLITSGGGADGAGDWTMDAAQTLENGITLTIENTGRIATITGNIEIIKAGTADQTLKFDVNNLLSTSA
jgi:hypothetical protein